MLAAANRKEPMHLRTVLRAVYRHKGFVYADERLVTHANRIEVTVHPRRGSKPLCSCCGNPGPTYDTLRERQFDMVPIWGLAVVLLYSMRRVDCRHCDRVVVESVPWSIGGKSRMTTAFAHHLASWARFLSWKEVGRRCGACWDSVAQSVKWMVDYGLNNRNLDGISAIGVDEIQYKKGHKYLTLVYEIGTQRRRLLWIGKERTQATFHKFFDLIGKTRSHSIEFVCSDMWKAYLNVIAKRAPNALNILDRFHIAKKLSDAVDETRRDEVTRLRQKGKPALLTKSRWLWLKRKANLTGKGRSRLRELLAINLTTVKAYLFKESFDHLWSYSSPTWAAKFLDGWCCDVMKHSSLPRMKKVAKTLRAHRGLILNYFQAKQAGHGAFSSGVVEGLNNKAKLCIRKSYGFRSDKLREVALFHALGRLPEPEATHRFG
jgi:transposase